MCILGAELLRTQNPAVNHATMSQQNTRSKRQALRFSAAGHPVEYKTEFENGRGIVENVSSGGCAMSSLTVKLNVQEKILIILNLDENEDAFEVGARVLRIEDSYVAVQFTDIEEGKREQLVKYFARKQREK
jgi:c-di-GMP-binding flagellar brake protein YcgR